VNDKSWRIATISVHPAMYGYGPRLTTWALQQVVSFLGYIRRAANVAATAESDPQETPPPGQKGSGFGSPCAWRVRRGLVAMLAIGGSNVALSQSETRPKTSIEPNSRARSASYGDVRCRTHPLRLLNTCQDWSGALGQSVSCCCVLRTYISSLGSHISTRNCQPSKLISIRPNSCHDTF
jgi:hypothetical protein